jgi:hypothetical protein
MAELPCDEGIVRLILESKPVFYSDTPVEYVEIESPAFTTARGKLFSNDASRLLNESGDVIERDYRQALVTQFFLT